MKAIVKGNGDTFMKPKKMVYSENGKKEEKLCEIIGIQFPLEEGNQSKDIIQAMSKMNCDGYDFHRIDGESSSAYFVFNSDVDARFQERGIFPDFNAFVKDILNDVNLESESGYYQFEGYKFWLGYELTSVNYISFLIRELNVDGCGGNAEASVNFPAGLSVEEINELENLLAKTKKAYFRSGMDASTDNIIEDALSVLKNRNGKTYQAPFEK